MIATDVKPYGVEWWYCLTSEPQPIREHNQMMSAADSLADIRTQLDSLIAGGYDVQRVRFSLVCVRCKSAGRIAHYPKGTRKDRRDKVPSWRMVYTECPTCKGEGHTHQEDYAL